MTFDPNFIFQPETITFKDGVPILLNAVTIVEILQSIMRAFPNPKLSGEEQSARDFDFRILKNNLDRGNQPLPSDYVMLCNILAQTGYKLFENPQGYEIYQLNIVEYLEALRDNDQEKYDKCVEYEKQFHQTDEQKAELKAQYEKLLEEYNKKLEADKQTTIEDVVEAIQEVKTDE